MAFNTPSYTLGDLFARIDRGDLQLPDFQRSYSWDVDRIRGVIVSILRGFPIGVLLALDTRDTEMCFRPRPLQGAPDSGRAPGLLLLDGQQRLTTIYHCFRGDGYVSTTDFRSNLVQRKFYVDVRKAISSPIMPDEALVSVDENGIMKSHFGPKAVDRIEDLDSALDLGLVPVSMLLGDQGTDLLFDLADRGDSQVREDAKRFLSKIAKPLVGYQVPMIRLERETAKGGVGSIFAQANISGLQMDVYDLLTAVFAADSALGSEFSLHADWAEKEVVLRQYPALDGIGRTEFLTAVSLFVSARKGSARGHREDILNITVEEYIPASKEILAGFISAADFLSQRCILSMDQVPYSAQIVPLAAILALLDEDDLANPKAWDRLNCWFWCGVFGELYGSSAVIARSGRDTDQVTAWVKAVGKEDVIEPKTVRDTEFFESRLLSAGPNTGVWKGLFALLMGRGARDWRTGLTFDRWTFDKLGAQFTQIFPSSWCAEQGIDPILVDSVLNHTPMGKHTEILTGDTPPNRYLPRLQLKSLLSDSDFDDVLSTHLLDPEDLHSSSFEAFISKRRRRLLGAIEYSIGKKAVHDLSLDEGSTALAEDVEPESEESTES